MVNANIRDPRSRLIARVRNNLLSMENIDLPLQRLHEGLAFSSSQEWANIPAGASRDVLIQTDPTVEMHIQFGVSTGGPTEIQLYEAPTFSGVGATMLTSNRNRRSSNTPLATVTVSPTVTTTGTLVAEVILEGVSTPGEGGITGGSIELGFDEWILDPGVDYLFRITNDDVVPANATQFMVFYEVEDGGAFPAVPAHQ